MCDIIGYSRQIDTEAGLKTFLFMRGTPRFEAGSRFKYTPDRIEFTYQNLVDAIADAIDEQAEEDGSEYVTNDRENVHMDTTSELDFDKLMEEFQLITSKMVAKDSEYYAPRITEIVERHLGKGKKVSECSRDQVMLIDIIVSELKEVQ